MICSVIIGSMKITKWKLRYETGVCYCLIINFFFSSRRRHTRCSRDWSSDVCSADLNDWFGKDNVMTAAALAIDAELKGEGYDPTDQDFRSEERRVGKECRSWWSSCH